MHQPGALAQLARDAGSIESALRELRSRCESPIDANLALRDGRGVSLGDAKRALHASPAWASQARAAERLHDELLDALDKIRSGDDRGASN